MRPHGVNPMEIALMDQRNSGRLPWVSARPAPKIGVIKGAISIAPITTAAESCSRPNAANIEDAEIKPRNSKLGFDPDSKSLANSARCWRCIGGATDADQSAYAEIAKPIREKVMGEVKAKGIDAAAAVDFIANEMSSYGK